MNGTGAGAGTGGASRGGDAEASYLALFRELEATVSELERDDLPLERAMSLFSRGVELSRLLASRLDAAEQEVYRLVEDAAGGFGLEPLRASSLGPTEDAADEDGENGIEDGDRRGFPPRGG